MVQESVVLGGGCFWCLDAVYRELRGVLSVESGYCGGNQPNPTYEQVCTGATGHAEVVRLEFDPELVSLEQLLQVFFSIHDPTTLNRQGYDVGTQYRSVIFCRDEAQLDRVRALVTSLEAERMWRSPVVTEVLLQQPFYPAEPYHQNYYALNPGQGYCQAVVSPKLAKFRARYASLLIR